MKLKLENPWKDEVDNRLLMAEAVLGAAMEDTVHNGNCDQDVLLAAQQLVKDARQIFERQHFPGNFNV